MGRTLTLVWIQMEIITRGETESDHQDWLDTDTSTTNSPTRLKGQIDENQVLLGNGLGEVKLLSGLCFETGKSIL